MGWQSGWSVVLKLGLQEKALGIQRSHKPRMWRSLNRCVEYLKKELEIARFELLDATNCSDVSLVGTSRQDSGDRLRKAHEAAAHDKWFREQVEVGLAEADDPSVEWVTNEEANASCAKKRNELVKRADGSAGGFWYGFAGQSLTGTRSWTTSPRTTLAQPSSRATA